AAKRLELLGAGLARATYLGALGSRVRRTSGRRRRCAGGGGSRACRATLLAASASPRSSSRWAGPCSSPRGHLVGALLLRRPVTAFCRDEVVPQEEHRPLWLAARAAALLWDYGSWDLLSARQVLLSRDAGALGVLPVALSTRAGANLFAGELAAAA